MTRFPGAGGRGSWDDSDDSSDADAPGSPAALPSQEDGGRELQADLRRATTARSEPSAPAVAAAQLKVSSPLRNKPPSPPHPAYRVRPMPPYRLPPEPPPLREPEQQLPKSPLAKRRLAPRDVGSPARRRPPHSGSSSSRSPGASEAAAARAISALEGELSSLRDEMRNVRQAQREAQREIELLRESRGLLEDVNRRLERLETSARLQRAVERAFDPSYANAEGVGEGAAPPPPPSLPPPSRARSMQRSPGSPSLIAGSDRPAARPRGWRLFGRG